MQSENYPTEVSKPKIVLNESENILFSVLISAADWHEQTQVQSFTRKLQLRIAGGWVRDKILGINSHDVDVAIDQLSGVDYCTILINYLNFLTQINKLPTALLQNKKPYKMSIIQANPDQSKHLETATIRLLNIDLDFVNLRANEVYHSNSRIPTQLKQFGTPLEDCLRRDLTINSLFYNLRRKEVEDYTQQGLQDLLIHKIIRTPCDPFITFDDDPLRILRSIRFAVRLNYSIDEKLKKAASNEKIQEVLVNKVSRERIGKELSGMFTGKNANPIKALMVLHELRLCYAVFIGDLENKELLIQGELLNQSLSSITAKPDRMNLYNSAFHYSYFCIELVSEFVSNQSIPDEHITILHLSSFLLPFWKCTVPKKKNKLVPLLEWILRDGIKFKSKEIVYSNTLLDNLPQAITLFHENDFSRLQLGLLLRKLRELWWICFVLAAIQETYSNFTLKEIKQNSSKFEMHQQQIKRKFHYILNLIYKFNLQECWKENPYLNGKELTSLLELQRGPIVGIYIEEQVKWTLEFPTKSKDECILFLKELRKKRIESGEDDCFSNDLKRKK